MEFQNIGHNWRHLNFCTSGLWKILFTSITSCVYFKTSLMFSFNVQSFSVETSTKGWLIMYDFIYYIYFSALSSLLETGVLM